MYSIKLLALVCGLFVVAQARKVSYEEREMFMTLTEECRNTHKATEVDVKNMLEGKVPETSTAKCTLTCVMQQYKTVKKNNATNCLEIDCETCLKWAEANGADKAKLDMGKEMCEKCKAPATTDDCEFSSMVSSCMQKEAAARGITIG